MSLTASIREQVRQRAQCACEFCGVTEIDVGGMLTIDHFQPRTKAGSAFQIGIFHKVTLWFYLHYDKA
jgi:5-methylcytosine-specific restriction endonuclease McrA